MRDLDRAFAEARQPYYTLGMDKRVTLKVPRRLYNPAKMACKQENTVNALATFLVQSWVDDKERDSNILPSAAAVRTVIRAEKKASRSIFPTQLPLIPPTLALDWGRGRWELFLASSAGNARLDSVVSGNKAGQRGLDQGHSRFEKARIVAMAVNPRFAIGWATKAPS